VKGLTALPVCALYAGGSRSYSGISGMPRFGNWYLLLRLTDRHRRVFRQTGWHTNPERHDCNLQETSLALQIAGMTLPPQTGR
ncbi:MAG: hypothetical protein NTV22_16915, partial [bacterium]|nr:hypothetical protein [bacterium]